MKKRKAFFLAGAAALILTACVSRPSPGDNVMTFERENERAVTLFSPMEKTMPDADNVARSASEKTVTLAEEKLGVTVNYIT